MSFPYDFYSTITSKPSTGDEFHFSDVVRECWRLWNLGLPFIRPLGYKDGNIWYNEELSYEGRFLDPILVFSFIVDLYRLRNTNLIGNYSLRFCTDYPPNKVVLIPELKEKLTKIKEQHLLELSREIINKSTSQYVSDNIQDFQLVCNCLEGLQIRVKKPGGSDYFEGSAKIIITECTLDTVSIELIVDSDRYRLACGIHGNVYAQKTTSSGEALLTFRVECTPDVDMDPWVETLRHWGDGIYSAETDAGEKQRNLLLSLEAEIENEQRNCIPYTIEAKFSRRGGWIILHPPTGNNVKAFDYWDKGIETGDMSVALNQSSDVREWTYEDIWQIIDIDESNPYKLKIRAPKDSNKKRPNPTGYLKPSDIGTSSLLQRKQSIIQHSLTRNTIITDPESYPEQLASDFLTTLPTESTLHLLQGPPGTGKTWTAAQIVKKTLEWNPSYRILLSAKEHLALDHLCDVVADQIENAGHNIVRINTSHSNNDNNRTKDPFSPASVGLQLINKIIDQIPDIDKRRKILNATHQNGVIEPWVENLAIHTSAIICTTTLDAYLDSIITQNNISFDLAIIEEAGKSYPSEILGPISTSMNSVLIGDHQQLPPFELYSIQDSLKKVVNQSILKNAKHTGNRRTINQMSIAPWDEEVNYNRLQNQITQKGITSLQPFENWFTQYSANSSTLRNQWRLFQELSNIVGSIFYNRPFNNQKQNKYTLRNLPKPWRNQARIIMIDYPHASYGKYGEKRTRGGSLQNQTELETALPIFQDLLNQEQDVVFLTPYLGQVKAMKNRVSTRYHERIRTVDGFQGREADFVILSLVRNNTRTGLRRWGFVGDSRRLNVALSRSREALLILTSVQHIEETDWETEGNPLLHFVHQVSREGKIENLSHFMEGQNE